SQTRTRPRRGRRTGGIALRGRAHLDRRVGEEIERQQGREIRGEARSKDRSRAVETPATPQGDSSGSSGAGRSLRRGRKGQRPSGSGRSPSRVKRTLLPIGPWRPAYHELPEVPSRARAL